MAVVISAANLNQEETKVSINYKNNTGAAGSAKEVTATGSLSSASVVVSKGETKKDATYESLLQEADQVKEQIMTSASTAKASLKALFQKLSGAEAVKLDEDGFHLTDADTEDMVNIIEKIRIELAMHSEDYVPVGGSIDSEKVEQVTGSVAMANSLESKLASKNIVPTEETITEVKNALEKASQITPLSENVKNYMVANEIPPTIDGIYEAEHAVGAGKERTEMWKNSSGSNGDVDKTFEDLRGQIEKIIEDAGLPKNNETLDTAKRFLQEQIPITKENLLYKAQLDQLNLEHMDTDWKQEEIFHKVMDNMQIGESAGSTLLTDEPPVLAQVADVIDTLNKADISVIEDVTKSNLAEGKDTFTIQDLKNHLALAGVQAGIGNNVNGIHHSNQEPYIASINTTDTTENIDTTEHAVPAGDAVNTDSQQAQVQKNYQILQEARILMTASAGVFLAKEGMNLYTTSVYALTEQLKHLERNQNLYEAFDEEVYKDVFEVRQAVFQVAQAPEVIIGSMLKDTKATLGAFAQKGNQFRQQYDRAHETYEAVGTEVRKDLGDSLKKAVEASTDSILAELDLEDNSHNRAAVRILASNAMDMTEENIHQVKALHEKLQFMIAEMKPETVLRMIRDQINPLTASIDDVNAYLMAQNELATDNQSEKYSRFLYKLEHTEGIDAEERQQFIGIYKMMNIFTKDAGKSIGALVKQGRELTMGNLMTAYESSKAAGMDVALDEHAGMATITGTVQYFQSLFANTGNQITPNTLKKTNEEQPISDYSVEKFCETIEDNYNPAEEAESLKGYVEALRKSVEADAQVIRQIEIAGQGVSINHIQAAESLLATGSVPMIFQKKNINGIEKIGHREELEQMYQEAKADTEKALEDLLAGEEQQTYQDINEARLANHEIGFIENLAMRHDYHIPVETENGLGMIHLTLVGDTQEQGKISIEMQQEDIGNISLEAKISGEKAQIFVLSDGTRKTKETQERLEERLHHATDLIQRVYELEDVQVYQADTQRMPERFYEDAAEKTATEQLYGMAQILVKALANHL